MVHKISCRLFLLILLTNLFSAACGPAQPPSELSRLDGCWWGYWDIPFYGGKAYIGLEIRTNRRGRPTVIFHRITNEEEHWTTSKAVLEQNTLIFPGPRGSEYRLQVDGEARILEGIYRTRDMDIPTRLHFSREITEANSDPGFFKNSPYVYTQPPDLDDGLIGGSLSEAGLDPALIRKLTEDIRSGALRNIRSLLVIKDDKLVVEEYFWRQSLGGFPYRLGRDDGQNIYSATRSITAALVGMAVDQGLISGVNEKISHYFPEYRDLFNSGEKKRLTVEHLLTMESGFQWGKAEIEAYQSIYDPLRSGAGAPIIKFVLGLPLSSSPGASYLYNNELSTILGEIVRRSSSALLTEFADRHLFALLGIKDYHWFSYPDGVAAAGNGLRMRPRDMAKFGLLILNDGLWKDRRLLSKSWLESSFQRRTAIGDNPYGYHWWLDTFVAGGRRIEAASARGHFGQFIYVVPSLNMTAVFTSSSEEGHRWDQPVDIMSDYLIPAAVPSVEQREDPAGIPVGKGILKSCEGVYRFREDRAAVLGVKGDALFIKPPGKTFIKLTASGESSFFSKDRGIFISLKSDDHHGAPILTFISGNIEEQGIKLLESPGGTLSKRIFFFPKTRFLFYFRIITALFLTGLAGWLITRLNAVRKRFSTSLSNRFPRSAGIWGGISAIGAIALTRIILSDGSALEEDINLGTYTSGWDERIAVCGLLLLTAGLIVFTIRLWLGKKRPMPAKILYSVLTLASLGLIRLLWASGLLAAFL